LNDTYKIWPYRRFQIGCVFVEYDLFNTTTFIQNIYEILYKFDTVIYQFFETGQSDRCFINIV